MHPHAPKQHSTSQVRANILYRPKYRPNTLYTPLIVKIVPQYPACL